MALAPLPARLSSRQLELAKLNAEVDKFTIDTINHLKSLRLRIEGLETELGTTPGSVILTAAPTRGIGGGNSAGAGPALIYSNHDHAIRETSGPTDLTVGSILANEAIRRVGSVLVGQGFEIRRLATAVNTTSTTAVDVDPDLTFALVGGRVYMVLWVAFYRTAATTTGMLFAMNYSAGLTANPRYGLLGATALTTMQSATAGANDTLVGQAGVGPGATDRVALVAGIYRPSASANGSLAMRYATGVAASAVTVQSNSFAVVIQL